VADVMEQKRVAVRIRAGNAARSYGSTGAPNVFNDHGLLQVRAHRLTKQAPHRVRWASCGERYDDGDGLFGILGMSERAVHRRKRGEQSY
jgi:hypothetical protein